MPLTSTTSPVPDGVRIAAVVVAVALAATGCTQRAGVADKAIHASHGHDEHAHSHDDHDHDHDQSHAPGKPAVDFPGAVAEVVRLDDTIRKAFAEQDTAAADEPIHAIGHLLEQLPELANAHGSGVDVAAVKKSSGLLFEAYSRIDGKLHGGDGSDYDTEAQGIARELSTFRAFLVPPGSSAQKRD
jgi:ABC-type Zn2+ transport system substrate-binding protein/surface adhesin